MNRRLTHSDAPERIDARQGGYVLVMLALLMIPLVASVGFATDVGSWYLAGNRLQKAADSASLAGVVWLPDLDEATAVAEAALLANGFDPNSGRYDVVVTQVSGNRLNVEITDTDAELYFSKLVIDEVDITRDSTAEYQRALELGSPLFNFGNAPDCNIAECSPNFWAAIQAPHTRLSHGDPFATSCIEISSSNPGSACATSNPDYRPEGYWYAVEVSQASIDEFGGMVPIQIHVYDGGFVDRGSLLNGIGEIDINATNGGSDIRFEVFQNDNTLLDHTDNPSWPGGACARVFSEGDTTGMDAWTQLCRIEVTEPTVFPINVRSSGLPDSTGSASMHYSLRVLAECNCSPTEHPRIFAVEDFSIFANVSGASTEVFLGEIDEETIGKEVVIDLFDPGDGTAGDYFLSIINPQTNAAWNSCTANDRFGAVQTYSPCRIQTSQGGASWYQGEWLTIRIDVPNGYTCTGGATGCWWKVDYEFPVGAQPTDRLTIRMDVIGDPVRLVQGAAS